tara:strand:+ start:14074 stop:14232 length:159 start_codon:yes stop_codon:yes gene_type:complete
MKLSEQIAQTCCGVLADKQDMVDRAKDLEWQIERHEESIADLNARLMEIDSA